MNSHFLNDLSTNFIFSSILKMIQADGPELESSFIVDAFAAQGLEATENQIKSWALPNEHDIGYQPMPGEYLNAFIDEMTKRRLEDNGVDNKTGLEEMLAASPAGSFELSKQDTQWLNDLTIEDKDNH